MDDVLALDATGQAELVRTGAIAPDEPTKRSIAALDRLDPQLDLVLHKTYDAALAAAKDVDLAAPFCGVPMLLKDLEIQAKDMPYSFGGMPFLREDPIIGTEDSNLAADLRKAGTVFLGRSNMSLGAFLPTHDVEAHVMPKNPWDPAYSTSGSSSGSAAAVASQAIAIGHGGDGGGSIRLPASFCGVVGMKPTRGLVSVGPHRSEVFSFGSAWSHEFVMTRSVRDTAGILRAVQGWRPGDSMAVTPKPARTDRTPLRIGLTTIPFTAGAEAHPETIAAAEATAKVLAELGHSVEVVETPRMDLADVEWEYGAPAAPYYVTIARAFDRYAKRLGRELVEDDLGPQMWAALQMGRGTQAVAGLEWAEVNQREIVRYDRWWVDSGIDVLLTPTVPMLTWPMSELLPPPHGTFEIPEDNPFAGLRFNGEMVPFTQIFNWTGQPAISLPLATDSRGLPLGVQLAAARCEDELLLELSFALEEAMPWKDRTPAVVA